MGMALMGSKLTSRRDSTERHKSGETPRVSQSRFHSRFYSSVYFINKLHISHSLREELRSFEHVAAPSGFGAPTPVPPAVLGAGHPRRREIPITALPS